MSSSLTLNQMQDMANPDRLQGMNDEARQALVESIFQKISDLGVASYEQGHFERAKEIFAELVQIAPQSGYAHAALGTVLTKLGENEAALDHLNRALAFDPNEISAWVNRAEVYLRFNRYQEAVNDLQQAISLNPAGDSPVAQRARYILNTLIARFQSEEGKAEVASTEEENTAKTRGLLRSFFAKLSQKK